MRLRKSSANCWELLKNISAILEHFEEPGEVRDTSGELLGTCGKAVGMSGEIQEKFWNWLVNVWELRMKFQ